MATKIEEPKGKALEEFRRQRDEQRQMKAEKEAGAPTLQRPVNTIKKAKGGYVRAADGCAKRGKTRGKMV